MTKKLKTNKLITKIKRMSSKKSHSKNKFKTLKKLMIINKPKNNNLLHFMWPHNAPITTKWPTYGTANRKCPNNTNIYCTNVVKTSSCWDKHNSGPIRHNGTKYLHLNTKSSLKTFPSVNASTCSNCFIFTLSLGFTPISTPKSTRTVSRTFSQRKWYSPTGWRIATRCLTIFCRLMKSLCRRKVSWW